MAQAKTTKKSKRIDFGSSKIGIDYPDFLDIQLKSFEEFLIDTLPRSAIAKDSSGVRENFPITDTRNQFVLEFLTISSAPPALQHR